MASGDSPGRPADPFQVLGIGPDADDREVRRAFAAKLREAKAAADPAAVERVQMAFEAIRDPAGREQVRSILRDRGRFEAMVAQARDALERKDQPGALRLSEEVLGIAPGYEPALRQVAILGMRLGEHEKALAAAARLTDGAPHSPEHWDLRARVLATAAEECPARPRRRQLFEEALACARQARERGKADAGQAILESMILVRLGRKQESRAVVARPLRDATALRSDEVDLFLRLLRLK